MSQAENLTNINVLNREQYNGVETPSQNELWVVKMETYHDDDGNWYRIYPDGWIEQGGKIVPAGTSGILTFLKPMKNTNYSIMSSETGFTANSSDTGGVPECTYWSNFTDTSARYSCVKGRTIFWEVKGYVA